MKPHPLFLLLLPLILTIADFASAAPTPIASTAPSLPRPVVLVRSGWQTVNIGDIAHTPGLLTLLQKFTPQADLILWPMNIDEHGAEAMIRHYFPGLPIVQGRITDGQPDTPELRDAFTRADLLLYSSAPELHVAARDVPIWRALNPQKPYGFYGITIDRQSLFARITNRKPLDTSERDILDHASFVLCRETTTLDYLKRENIRAPLLDFTPDAVFGVNQYDTTRATAWLREKNLQPGRYICVIPRTRFAPYYKMQQRPPTENDLRREAYNAEHTSTDLGKLRDTITRWIRQTRLPVIVCPEMLFEVELSKTEIINKLPDDVRPLAVWKNTWWLPDEAAAIYRNAIALLSMECHSPIIAIAAGTPALYLRTPTETSKGQMWSDIGLGDWMIDLDSSSTTGETLAAELLRIHKTPTTTRAKLACAMSLVTRRQQEALHLILGRTELARARPASTNEQRSGLLHRQTAR
ncbi:polysaccharide pyruvyl transferase family protein [Geminisphaera colitermitum]|uniref:polysaccharide pyruvyl transferase family protein n=1 Tax=Geminisphaera colitermitum TaxID=1148786 RepID=UPI000196560E|nr:polysaccharide pyruvyl transferase family protein [Geminisphaera colitermitum]